MRRALTGSSRSFVARRRLALSSKARRRRPRVGFSNLKCEVRDVAAAAAVLFLAFALSGGMILGRAASDLLFYGCALAQAALAIFGARLAVRRGACVLAVLIVGATLLRVAFVF